MIKYEIKYKYAHNPNKKVVLVSELNKGSELEKYTCIECGGELIPKLGDHRQYHFSHYIKTECSPESYLHKLAKEKFLETYSECLRTNTPYYLEFNTKEVCVDCKKYGIPECDFIVPDKIDLISKYKVIEIEKKDGNSIADILLKDENCENEHNNTIHIEFAVTNRKEKPEKRTIEFILENESDISLITKRYIPVPRFMENKSKIKMYNFQLNTKKNKSHRANCFERFDIVRIYKNGKFECLLEPIAEYENKLSDPNILSAKIVQRNPMGHESYKLYEREFLLAIRKYKFVRNCYVCKFCVYNKYKTDHSLFCNLLKKEIIADDALNCKSFVFSIN